MRDRALDPLDPALDLERHARHAIVLGLVLAAFLPWMAVAHALLTPTEARLVAPRPLVPIEFDVNLAAAPPPTPVPLAVLVPEPAPVARTAAPRSKPKTPAPAPVPPPPVVVELPVSVPDPAPAPPPVITVTRIVRGPDRSSPARLGGAVQWRCPWPTEADHEMRHMVVKVAADVRADGTPVTIRVVSDPGYGFGRAAQACAMRHTYVPSRDETGTEADGTTLPFAVHFDRY